ncbi:MAG: MmgE/PrpD family protein [Burkholderiales bacterium]
MLPAPPSANNSTTPPHVEALSRFAAETRYADLPASVIESCKILYADCIAVIAAGMQSAEMRALVNSTPACGSDDSATVIGAGRDASAEAAAFLNGIAATWHDFDAGNTRAHGHPGTYVVPAALADAQTRHISGRDLLLATVLGYEVCARVGLAAKMRIAVHPHGTYGTIGAAVALARLRGFDAAKMGVVMNIAATMAMATNRQAMLDEATVRNLYTGHTAQAGQTAVRLADAGFTGQRDGIGFTYGSVIADGFDPALAIEGLGADWLIDQGYLKLHPAGRYAHAAIDAMEDALAAAPGAPPGFAAIDRIEVRGFRHVALLSGKRVTTSFGAKFSIPFALATILYHGRSALDCFEDAAVQTPAIQALAQRVDVTEDPAYTAAYPGQHRCDVTLFLKSGAPLTGHCTVMKGDPGNPHPPDAVRRKFFDLTVPVWGEGKAAAVYDACMRLEQIPDVRAVPL